MRGINAVLIGLVVQWSTCVFAAEEGRDDQVSRIICFGESNPVCYSINSAVRQPLKVGLVHQGRIILEKSLSIPATDNIERLIKNLSEQRTSSEDLSCPSLISIEINKNGFVDKIARYCASPVSFKKSKKLLLSSVESFPPKKAPSLRGGGNP